MPVPARIPSLPAFAGALALSLATAAASAAAPASPAPELSLEDLMKVEVVSASRKTQALQDVAAAVHVISRDDIQRSGASTLPEVLRLAPGVEVAHLNGNRWAVTARGFNGRFANKLLVLVDGRNLYSTLMAGVFWDVESTAIDDIERIEVIRGPGAAMWGVNAVNGVINIITRKAADTHGTRVSASAGNVQKLAVDARHGGGQGDHHWRVWGRAESNRGIASTIGRDGADRWHEVRLGGRVDSVLGGGQTLTVGANAVSGLAHDLAMYPDLNYPGFVNPSALTQHNRAANLSARWARLAEDGSETTALGTLEWSSLGAPETMVERRRGFSLDVQHHPRLGGSHDVVFGGHVNVVRDAIGSGPYLTFEPPQRTTRIASLFVNDDITLIPERLHLSAGMRLEYQNGVGWEPQPQVRLGWTPDRRQILWTALSRAARTPSRGEIDGNGTVGLLPPSDQVPVPVLIRSQGPGLGGLDSEHVTSLEFGWRRQFDDTFSLDLAAYHSRYQGLRSSVMLQGQMMMSPVPHLLQPMTMANSVDARTSGLEAALDWRVNRRWRLQAMGMLAHHRLISADTTATAMDPTAILLGSSPRRQGMLRSSYTFDGGHTFDLRLRHVGALASVPAYTTLDAHLNWRLTTDWLLGVSGENLLGQHAEFQPDIIPAPRVDEKRRLRVRLTGQF